MIRYVLTSNGVKDRVDRITGRNHPDCKTYQRFLAWVDEGNTPIPQSPGLGYVLVGDEWVLDQSIIDRKTLAEKKLALKEKLLELFKFQFEMFSVLRDKGIIAVADFPAELITKAQAWKQLLDDIDDLE